MPGATSPRPIRAAVTRDLTLRSLIYKILGPIERRKIEVKVRVRGSWMKTGLDTRVDAFEWMNAGWGVGRGERLQMEWRVVDERRREGRRDR